MNDKIKVLLDKINIDNNYYQYFNDAEIKRIVVSSRNGSWNIYIDKKDLLPLEALEQVEENVHLLDEKAPEITIIWNIENPSIDTYLSYYKYLLKT